MKNIITLIFCLVIPAISYGAAGSATGNISSVTIKENGYIIITFDAAHDNPMACERNNKVAIDKDHIAKKEILSVVLSAHAMQKSVSFHVNDCYVRYGTSYPLGVTATVH